MQFKKKEKRREKEKKDFVRNLIVMIVAHLI